MRTGLVIISSLFVSACGSGERYVCTDERFNKTFDLVVARDPDQISVDGFPTTITDVWRNDGYPNSRAPIAIYNVAMYNVEVRPNPQYAGISTNITSDEITDGRGLKFRLEGIVTFLDRGGVTFAFMFGSKHSYGDFSGECERS